jgi:uncharacterized membrane protein YbhN (UPF0104 family)
MLIIAVSYNYSLKRPHDLFSAFKGNLVIIVLTMSLFIIILGAIYFAFVFYDFRRYLFIFGGVILTAINLYNIKALLENSMTDMPTSIARDVFKWEYEPHFGKSESRELLIISFFSIILVLSLIFAAHLGYYAASSLDCEATLYLKQPQENIDGKIYLLVMHDEANYYLVEKYNYLSSVPSYYPTLYITPSESIKLMEYYGRI